MAKVTDNDVRWIRQNSGPTGLSIAIMARALGVSPKTIKRIATRKYRSSVPDVPPDEEEEEE